jgi:hypothetical protein
MKDLFDLIYSIQRALLQNVTPNLRAVYAFIENDTYVIIFYYDHTLSEDEEELASLTETGLIADFPYSQTRSTIEVIPYPEKIPQKGFCVYQRYEEDCSFASYDSNDEIKEQEKTLFSQYPMSILFHGAQKALLGNITPNLRYVSVNKENEPKEMIFCYDQSLSEKEKELFKNASTKFISEIPEANCRIEIVPYPKYVPKKGYGVYARYEHYDD